MACRFRISRSDSLKVRREGAREDKRTVDADEPRRRLPVLQLYCTLRACVIQLSRRTTFEVIAAYVHRAGFSTVVVVYRPSSCCATQGFFDDLDDLLERLATSAPLLIVDDFNIHVGDITEIGAGKLHKILTAYGLSQHIRSSTHRHSHVLDMLISRDNQAVNVFPIDPPLLSDHSFIVANLDCAPLTGQ